MRYVPPFYREVEDDNNERFAGGVLIPFLGGALLGGLFASSRPNNYIPYNNYPPYYAQPQPYPYYYQYPTYYMSPTSQQYPYN